MAEAYRKALAYVERRLREGADRVDIQMSFPTFIQGQFVVNRIYSFNPPIIGMYTAQKKLAEFNRDTLNRILELTRRWNLKFELSGVTVFLKEKGTKVAWIKENFFGASKPELFENIGRQIFNLNPVGGVTEGYPRFKIEPPR